MSNSTIILSILAVFLVINLVIVALSGCKLQRFTNFSIGNRSFSSFAIFASLSASFIGGGYTLGNASKVYMYGMVFAIGLLGFSLKEILIGFFIVPFMDKFQDCLSVGDIIEKNFGRNAKILIGIFSVIICIGILGAQVSAMGVLFSFFFKIPSLVGIFLGFSVILFICYFGGMKAVVYTDVFQFVILFIALPLLFFIGVWHLGGFKKLFMDVPLSYFEVFNVHDNYIMLPFIFFSFFFGEILIPPYVQRLFMTKNSKQTKRAVISSGLLSIPFFLIVGGIGLVGYAMNNSIQSNNVIPYVILNTLSPVMEGIVIASLVAVIMSSASSFLNAASVSLTNDVIRELIPNLSESSLLKIARFSTILFGVGAIVFATSIKNILDILLFSYSLWSPIILMPLISCIVGIKTNKYAFWASAIGGACGVCIWTCVFHDPLGVSGVLTGVLGNIILFFIFQFFIIKKKGIQNICSDP